MPLSRLILHCCSDERLVSASTARSGYGVIIISSVGPSIAVRSTEYSVPLLNMFAYVSPCACTWMDRNRVHTYTYSTCCIGTITVRCCLYPVCLCTVQRYFSIYAHSTVYAHQRTYNTCTEYLPSTARPQGVQRSKKNKKK